MLNIENIINVGANFIFAYAVLVGFLIGIGLKDFFSEFIYCSLMFVISIASANYLISRLRFFKYILVLISFSLTKIFGPKFAFLSVGLIMGSIMFGNVFTVIIPNQMNIISSSSKNEKFDASLSLAAKQRSIHNNYSTFLVLFIMLSGHYSFIVYHKYNWLILCTLAIISAFARHYFNLRGKNIHRLYILIFSILALVILAVLLFIFKN